MDPEIPDMKARLAALEAIILNMTALIAQKDDELAAAMSERLDLIADDFQTMGDRDAAKFTLDFAEDFIQTS